MIWLDQDGVLADFDGYYETCFGYRPNRWPESDTTDWKLVNSVPDFFLKIPALPDAHELFRFAVSTGKGVGIMTGIPSSIDAADNHKRKWAAARWPDTLVVCCPARSKWEYGEPGDVLIDDYLRYRVDWERMGGIFIPHKSAKDSIHQLRSWGIAPCEI